jgi:TP901 family phage tail tape measure protein
MADAKSVVELVFQGRDETAQATRSALENAQKFTQSIQSVTGPLADAGKAVLKFEAALLGAGLAITAFSIKAAGDFDTAFRELTTIFQIPEEGLGQFRESILEYASSSTQSLSSITAALYSAGSAGLGYAESLEFLTTAERVSVAGRADLNESTKVLVSTLNAYGLGVDSAQRFSDVFFQTVKDGQITIPELSANLAKVTAAASTLGVPIEEVGAAIAQLTSKGVEVSAAFTQVASILAAYIAP